MDEPLRHPCAKRRHLTSSDPGDVELFKQTLRFDFGFLSTSLLFSHLLDPTLYIYTSQVLLHLLPKAKLSVRSANFSPAARAGLQSPQRHHAPSSKTTMTTMAERSRTMSSVPSLTPEHADTIHTIGKFKLRGKTDDLPQYVQRPW